MLKKAIQKSGNTYKVTSVLPAEVNAETACLCGDFNDWDATQHPMKKQKDGSFKVTLTLDIGRQYQFRYLTDNSRWENDYEADAYKPNPYGSENSVVNVEFDHLIQ